MDVEGTGICHSVPHCWLCKYKTYIKDMYELLQTANLQKNVSPFAAEFILLVHNFT